MNRAVTENKLYQEWLDRTPENISQIQQKLYDIFIAHASSMIHQFMRHSDPDLAHDITARVMMRMDHFKGDSTFTTWVHRVILNSIYRKQLEIKEQSVECDIINAYYVAANEDEYEKSDLDREVEGMLSPEQLELYRHMFVEGYSAQDVSNLTGKSQSKIARDWATIREILRDGFSK